MVARTTDGRLVVYAGDGKDSLTRAATLAGSFAGTRFALLEVSACAASTGPCGKQRL